MTKKRHNIDTIAEVLIDKLTDMERTAKRIETASQKELKIDTSKLEELLDGQKREEESILSHLTAIQKKNSTRVPNWVLGVLGGLIMLSFGAMFYAWSKAEAYGLQKQKAEYFEQEYNKLKQ